MKNVIKWGAITGGIIFILIVAALLIVPQFLDIHKYKPFIEKKVKAATGCPFTLGGDLSLSLFPWVGLTFSDLHLGNPPGFKEKDFLAVKSFEVRVKLLPLLSKDIQVKHFILKGPRLVLEKNTSGQGNWEGIGKPVESLPPTSQGKQGKPSEPKSEIGLPIKSLAVGEFSITEGSILWMDHGKAKQSLLSDVNFRIRDVSLDRPVNFDFSARLNKKPISVQGEVGPLSEEPLKGTIPLNITAKITDQLVVGLTGKVMDLATRRNFELTLNVAPFSPRKIMSDLGQDFPVNTADPEALKHVAVKAKLAGDQQNLKVSEGLLSVDQSAFKFSAGVREFSRPDINFDLNLNEMDLNRYLPPKKEKKFGGEKTIPPSGEKKPDYKALRKLAIEGEMRAGKLKAYGAGIQDLHMKISGKNGLFYLDPLGFNFYQGSLSSKAILDIRKDTPRSKIDLLIKEVKARPLLNDLMNKNFVEGTARSTISVELIGDDTGQIKRTLNGTGYIHIDDGAIVGIDMGAMVRNIKTAFIQDEIKREVPRTDFTEFHFPFMVRNGVVNTSKTTLSSPLIRVAAAGFADLTKDTLNFRVEPMFVAVTGGHGDTPAPPGFKVPVLVSGSFSSIKFRPDLNSIVKKITEPSELQKLLPGMTSEEKPSKKVEEKIKELFKSFSR